MDREQARQEEHARRMEQQAHGAATSVAANEAGAGGSQITLDEIGENPDLVETLFSPGIGMDSDDLPEGVTDDLEDFLSAEFGRHLGLGNITREEYLYEKEMDRARALAAIQGFRKQGRSGSECTGETRRIMTGERTDPPEMNDRRARSIRSAYQERTMMRSLSIRARGWRGLTEFIGNVRSEASDIGGDSDGGILSRVANKLP